MKIKRNFKKFFENAFKIFDNFKILRYNEYNPRSSAAVSRIGKKRFFVSQNAFFTMTGGFFGGVKSAEKNGNGLPARRKQEKSNIKIYK